MKMLGRLLPVGPRSVLFGAHCWFIHPWFVAAAWWRLYGAPRDPRLLVAFFVHDLGYLMQWCHAMDDAEGERHVEWGARLMRRLFGPEWGDFCLFHSRFYAKAHGRPVSRLCVADKLAIVYTPAWLYLPMVNLSGEIVEYMALAKARTAAAQHEGKYTSMNLVTDGGQRQWFDDVRDYLRRWVAAHRDGAEDTWTPGGTREATGQSGVWR